MRGATPRVSLRYSPKGSVGIFTGKETGLGLSRGKHMQIMQIYFKVTTNKDSMIYKSWFLVCYTVEKTLIFND